MYRLRPVLVNRKTECNASIAASLLLRLGMTIRNRRLSLTWNNGSLTEALFLLLLPVYPVSHLNRSKTRQMSCSERHSLAQVPRTFAPSSTLLPACTALIPRSTRHRHPCRTQAICHETCRQHPLDLGPVLDVRVEDQAESRAKEVYLFCSYRCPLREPSQRLARSAVRHGVVVDRDVIDQSG